MRSLQLSIASDTLSAQGPKSMERPKPSLQITYHLCLMG